MSANNQFFCQWNCERFLSSSKRQQMGLVGTGMYTLLLNHQFLLGEEGLPTNERQLRGLIGFHTDAEWEEYWPLVRLQFEDRQGRLFNIRMLEEYRRVVSCVENGKKGGRPKRSKNLKQNLIPNPDETQPLTQSETQTLTQTKPIHHPPSTIHHSPSHEPPPTRARGGEPKPIGGVAQDAAENIYRMIDPLELRIRRQVGEDSWGAWRNLYLWAIEQQPSITDELTRELEDSKDPEKRSTKGISEKHSPGRWFTSQLEERCTAIGVKVPRVLDLKRQEAKV